MTDDLLADLARLQSYAAGLQSLLEEARASSPQTAQGSDRSGAVTMTIGQDGLPLSIRVGADWARKIQPTAFAAAVVEASQAAQGERMGAWVTALERDGWQAKVDRLESELGTSAPPTPSRAQPTPGPAAPGVIPPAFRRPPTAPPPRPLGIVVEDALRTFDDVERYRPPPPGSVQGQGRAGGAKFTLTLSAEGLVACVADPRWVAGQTPATLANTFSAATAEAKAALAKAMAAAAQAAPVNPVDRLQNLFGETMALLADPRRLAES
jgi:hypothetical protein